MIADFNDEIRIRQNAFGILAKLVEGDQAQHEALIRHFLLENRMETFALKTPAEGDEDEQGE